jgi:glutathione S-transferase
MNTDRHLVLFHAPNSRSTGVLTLLEELGADHALRLINLRRGDQRRPEYLAVNPMGKVPALLHGDALITEQPAIYQYAAELYPEAGLSPAVGDPLRGPYLRWLAFYGSCFEPALSDLALKREPGPHMQSPYGSAEEVIATVQQQLARGPWLLGERFTAADLLWGKALSWMVAFKLFPDGPAVRAYTERFNARPAVQRAAARDAELAAQQQAELAAAPPPAP